MKYKMMKVFDCQDMPEYMKEGFFDTFRRAGNNTAVIDIVDKPGTFTVERPFHEWLVANGAEYGEDVVIKYWW